MAPLASIRQVSRQVSRSSRGEYQSDEQAGVEWLRVYGINYSPFRGTGCLILGGFFWLCRVARGILVPGSDIEHLLPAMEAQILNH